MTRGYSMEPARLLLSLTLIGFAVAGCATVSAERDRPDWFLNPPTSNDSYYGVGVSESSSESMAKTLAEADARADIATNIRAQVQQLVDQVTQEGTVDGKGDLVEFGQIVSRQITDETLYGTVVEERYLSDDGTMYVLMSYPKAALVEYLKLQEEIARQFEISKEFILASEIGAELLERTFGTDSPFGTE